MPCLGCPLLRRDTLEDVPQGGRRRWAGTSSMPVVTIAHRHARSRREARLQASARTVRATRFASVMIVTIGFTPDAVGNSDPSAT